MRAVISFAILFGVFPLDLWSQNSINNLEVISNNNTSLLRIELQSGEYIDLKTYISKSEIRSIESYGTDSLLLLMIEAKNMSGYYINAAFKSKTGWVQDYRDRQYVKLNTGMSCTQITSIEICDTETLSIEYETTTTFNGDFKVRTDLLLGKYAMHETSTGLMYGFTNYGKGTKLSEEILNSPRYDYSTPK